MLVLGHRPKNILVIALDTTRRDALGRYSGDPEASPTLDTLMSQAVVLDNHRGCSNWTWDSVLCVQTGRDPPSLGFAYVDSEGTSTSAPESVEFVSETLQAMGFQTALASAQRYMSPDSHLDQGFSKTLYQSDAIAETLRSQALELLQNFDPTRPWYLHLHFMDPHELYAPPEEYLGGLDELPPLDMDLTDRATYEALRGGGIDALSEEDRALVLAYLWVLYQGEIRYFDDQLAGLMSELDAGGWLEDTLVLFWTDHGEQIWQHDYSTHGASLYEEENRAVSFFWAKDIEPLSWTGPTTHQDLWPTIFQVLGLSYPPGFTGVPLGGRPDDDPIFALRYRGDKTFQSVVYDGKKLVYKWNGTEELYDLVADPSELSDIYDPKNPDIAPLWALLSPKVDEVAAEMGGPVPIAP